MSTLAAESFGIYCTSNQDGTGKCIRDDANEPLSCILIPGQVIACRDKNKIRYECVQYGAVVSQQTQFICNQDSDNNPQDIAPDSPGEQPANNADDPSNPVEPSATTNPGPEPSPSPDEGIF